MKNKTKLKNISTQVILEAAETKGIKAEIVSKNAQLLKLSFKNKSIYIQGTSFPVNSQPACLIANNKFLTKKILKFHNIPVPKSWLVKTAKEAKKLILKHNPFPFVIKPVRGSHGNGIYVNIESLEEFNEVLPLVFKKPGEKSILIEEFISGKDYRLVVVGNTVPAVLERIPAHIIGDGINNILQLIKINNQNPLVGIKYEKPMCKIKIGPEVKRNLKKQRKKLTDVPKKKETVFLMQNANISTGGIGRDATDHVGDELKKIAIKATKTIGMIISGVDIIYDEKNNKPYVLEINDRPGIDIHHYPAQGKSRQVASDIIDFLFKY